MKPRRTWGVHHNLQEVDRAHCCFLGTRDCCCSTSRLSWQRVMREGVKGALGAVCALKYRGGSSPPLAVRWAPSTVNDDSHPTDSSFYVFSRIRNAVLTCGHR
jgi:hypothetical protein